MSRWFKAFPKISIVKRAAINRIFKKNLFYCAYNLFIVIWIFSADEIYNLKMFFLAHFILSGSDLSDKHDFYSYLSFSDHLFQWVYWALSSGMTWPFSKFFSFCRDPYENVQLFYPQRHAGCHFCLSINISSSTWPIPHIGGTNSHSQTTNHFVYP